MGRNPVETRDMLFARFYDLEYRDYDLDTEFYVQYAQALDPDYALPVLELGCGTGRIALKLAEAGFRVRGVDNSEAMLELCQRKGGESGLLSRLTLTHADIRALPALDGPFNMAFCALNTFAYLLTSEEQIAALDGIRRQLVRHGVALVDLTPPLHGLLPPSDGEVLYQGTYTDEIVTVHKFLAGYAEPSRQLHHTRLIYDVEAADATLRRYSRGEVFRWTGRYEMQLLLERAGFRLEHVYGGYDLEEFEDASERMIFVART